VAINRDDFKKDDLNPFGFLRNKPGRSQSKKCADCEAMLADALDGTLTHADRSAVDLHLLGCPACSAMFADAQRGAAWLEMLKSPRPEPPAALLDRILAQTSESKTAPAPRLVSPRPVPSNSLLGLPALPLRSLADAGISLSASNVLPFRSRVAAAFSLRSIGQTLLQPRLAMTAAMAFFSIALTLNLTGVRLSKLHASDLRPSSIKRSIAEANAHVIRYYDNLQVVYELESRVNDLRSSDTNTDLPAAAPAATRPSSNQQPDQQPDRQRDPQPDQQKPAQPQKPHGVSRYDPPTGNLHFVAAESLPLEHLTSDASPTYVTLTSPRRSSYSRNLSRPMPEGSPV
jgi:hypothetical protein